MKILSRKNGIALIAVLTVLLVLTLLLPVMFKTSENATYSSVTEINRQKASYLARSGVEMTVAAVKGTMKSEDATFKTLYNNLKTKTAGNTVKLKDSTISGKAVKLAYMNVDTIWMFLDKNDKAHYVCGAEGSDKVNVYAQDTENYKFVGKTETTVTYNGEPQFFYVNPTTNKREEVEESVAIDATTGEINENYVAVYNSNYIVESKAVVNGQNATRKAVIVENLDTSSDADNEAIVAYTTMSSETAPSFINKIEGLTLDGKNEEGKFETFNYGGNQAFANPFKANSKKQVNAVKDYYNAKSTDPKYVYVYSTIGNMIIDADRDIADNGKDVVALGAFPGIRWRDSKYASEADKFSAYNYIAYADAVQRYNFMSFTATNVAQVKLPVDLRVTPARCGRLGDREVALKDIVGGLNAAFKDRNASLFKMVNIQAKDIVFEDRIDLMMSLYEATGNTDAGQDTAYRGGFLLLSAPESTPYSYHHKQLNKMVPAGIVYFTKDVYVWIIENGRAGEGSSSANISGFDAVIGQAGETMYRFHQVNEKSSFVGPLNRHDNEDLRVYKIINAGDVYYFNADIQIKDNGKDVDAGLNLVNWFLETKYLTTNEYNASFWDQFLNLRELLYKDYVLNTINDKGSSYYLDDLHYIGNMNDDKTLMAPDVEDEAYVIWSN